MMAQRTVLCSLCYGDKADGDGNRCVDCNGIGTFLYGEDRDPEAIQAELIQVRGFMEAACLELDRWEWTKERPEELIDVDGRVVPAKLKEYVDYWKFHAERLASELSECSPKPMEGERDGDSIRPDDPARTEQRHPVSKGTGRRLAGTRKP